jgi:UDP-N-acetyl-D-mannosaminuronate dehydrogenase
VTFHDPHVSAWHLRHADLKVVGDLDAALRSADLVVLLQAHKAYDLDAIVAGSKKLLDTRGAAPAAPHVTTL